MLNLSSKNIRLNGIAQNKNEAIKLVAQALVQHGNVAEGYENGMLAREQQTSTFLGNGIAIPHGTLDTRHLVKETGVQILQFPQGVEWGEGNVAYVVIGIAAKSDEHLALLRQLTTVLSDETAAETLAKTQDLNEFIAVLSGKKSLLLSSSELISLNVESDSLLTLSAINAGKLQEQGYVSADFVSDVIAQPTLSLGDNLFLNDSAKGNQANGVALAQNRSGKTVITVSAVDNNAQTVLSALLKTEFRQQLQQNPTALLNLISGGSATVNAEAHSDSQAEKVIGTFTLRNDNGLHARPVAELVKIVKSFDASISVENLDRGTAPVSAKSTMKILTLGAVKGSKLRFVAEGAQALLAIEAIKAGFENGLGEPVNFVPSEADTIEQSAPVSQAVENPQVSANTASETNANGELEATFVIRNEHGLHARPSAMLVAEVKKYNADIKVQNLDRNSDLVSAKSMMKIVALGVTKGHHLRFVATGEQAKEALEGIGKAIESGLGE